MNIQSDGELRVTRDKLQGLRRRYEQIKSDSRKTTIDRLTLQSLRRIINQLQEEIALYQSRVHHSVERAE